MPVRWFLMVLLLGCLPARAAEGSLLVVSSERSVAYQEATEALLLELERGGVSRQRVVQRTVAELQNADLSAAQMVLALGSEAAGQLARQEIQVPVLSGLLPRASFERILRESGRRPSVRFSALYLDQPLSRQFDLVRVVLPQARRVGVLLGPDSRTQRALLENVSQSRGLTLVVADMVLDEPVFQGLKKILPESDVLLALPDPQIFNSNSLQNILLSAFRAHVPLLSFSPAYVRAGALLALYVTPTQVGAQLGALARNVLQGRPMPEPQYPKEFSISVNEHVARSLGLRLDVESIQERLRRIDRAP